jgi:hypothetical protein
MLDSKKLAEAHKTHRESLATVRRNHKEAEKLCLGRWYGPGGSDVSQPVNLIELARTVYSVHLASVCPQSIWTARSELRMPAAYELGEAVNYLARKELNLDDVLRDWVVDAIMSPLGVLMVGVEPGTAELFSEPGKPGLPIPVADIFVNNVALDDYVWDTAAKRRGQRHFESVHMSVQYDRLVDSGMLSSKATSRLKTVEKNTEDQQTGQRLEDFAFDLAQQRHQNRIYKMCEVWYTFWPQEGKVTLHQADESLTLVGESLYEGDWIGPKQGPNHELTLMRASGQPFGQPPVSLWRDLHEDVNLLRRKMQRQAERHKINPTFRGAGEADATRLDALNDGQWARVEDPDGIGSVESGGVSPKNFAFMQDGINQFNQISAGNPMALAGSGPQAETAAQDAQVLDAASARLNDMKARLKTAEAKLFGAIGWHVHHEPSIVVPITKKHPGIMHTIEEPYLPEKRQGEFDYEFDVSEFSMQYQTPQTMIRDLDETFAIVQQAAATDPSIIPNTERYLQERARLRNNPILKELVIFANNPNAGEPAPSGGVSGERTYRRISQAADTPGKRQAATMEMMAAGDSESGSA